MSAKKIPKTPRHYQSNWLQPKRTTLKVPGSPKKEPRAVSLDTRLPSTKLELPVIMDEQLSASLGILIYSLRLTLRVT